MVRGDLQALRADLQTMRTDLGAKITAMEDGQFALPVNFAFDVSTVRDSDRGALDRFCQDRAGVLSGVQDHDRRLRGSRGTA